MDSVNIDGHATRLRLAGLRVTAPRLAVLGAIASAPHSTAEEVAGVVRERLGTVSKQAIYDVLHALTAAEILRRVAVDVKGAQYELAVGDNHHHFVCRQCGRLEDVPCPAGTPPCLEPEDHHGYLIEEAEVIYRGLCPECRRAD